MEGQWQATRDERQSGWARAAAISAPRISAPSAVSATLACAIMIWKDRICSTALMLRQMGRRCSSSAGAGLLA